jgi:serine/threonine protein kinase/Flp pilus assembly protein TadD
MGEVYLGRDETLGRRVAVKAMRDERRMETHAAERFLREARTLSKIEHPAICRLYEYFEHDGIDFIVMELVEGRTLAEAIEEGLEPAESLRIAIEIAGALVAAHSVSVAHRDLKPDNVMVTASGGVKVLDFGLAREEAAVEDDSTDQDGGDSSVGGELPPQLTRRGDVLGTPRYMSPEQARGEGGNAASDMYSFGLLVQELFTGQPPHPPELPFEAVLQRARWGDTRAPVGLGAPLTALIQHLKELRPGDRPTAVEAWTALNAIRDAPRRRLRRLGVAVVLLSLVIATVASTLGLQHARRSLRQAVEARAQSEAVSEFLGTMLTSPNPRTRGIEVKVVDVLDHAAATVGEDFADHPLRQAAVRLALGSTYRALGSFPEARAHLDAAVATRLELLGEGDPETLAALNELAVLQREMGELETSEATHRRVLDVQRRNLGEDHPATLQSMSNLGVVLYRRGSYTESEELLREVVRRQRALHGESGKRTLEALSRLANVIGIQGRYDEALELRRRILERTRASLGDDHANTLLALNNLGVTLSRLGRFEEAEIAYRQATEGRIRVLGAGHPETLMSMRNHGIALRRLGQTEAAERRLREVLDATIEALGPDHPRTAEAIRSLAILVKTSGRLDEAEALYRREIEIEVEALGDDHEQTLSTFANLANLLTVRQRYEEAESIYLRVLSAQRRTLGEEHDSSVATLYNYAYMLLAMGREDEAYTRYAESADLFRKALGTGHRQTLTSELVVASLTAQRGDPDRAEALIEDVITRAEASLGIDHELTASAREALEELRATR